MSTHTPYHIRRKQPHDFEVEYQILTEEEGGRKTLPYQGIRWDMWYENEDHEDDWLFMIHPEFLNEKGEVILEADRPVPIRGKARMWIINDEMRRHHQARIYVGMKAIGREGSRTVADYVVTDITGLMTNPAPEPKKK